MCIRDRATYQRAEFTPETSRVETKTFEINLVSNEPLFGALDWTVGAFYMQHDIEIISGAIETTTTMGRLATSVLALLQLQLLVMNMITVFQEDLLYLMQNGIL